MSKEIEIVLELNYKGKKYKKILPLDEKFLETVVKGTFIHSPKFVNEVEKFDKVWGDLGFGLRATLGKVQEYTDEDFSDYPKDRRETLKDNLRNVYELDIKNK